MKKYAELFQIGDVAKLCGISRKMLLNYEQQRLIAPTAVDPDSGYRYFDILTIGRVQLILDLRACGMSIADIGLYLDGKLSAQSQIRRLEEQKLRIEQSIRDLRRRGTEGEMRIEYTQLPEQYCICRELEAADIDEAERAFAALYRDCIRRGLVFDGGGYHFCEFLRDIRETDCFETEHIHMRICISIRRECAPDDAVMYPTCRAVTVNWYGSLENSVSAYDKLRQFINENHCDVCGYPRELYMEGNFTGPEENRFITQIAVPVLC